MGNDENTVIAGEKRAEVEIQIHLTEFQKVRDELLQTLNSQQQLLVLILGSASIVFPLIGGQISNLSSHLIASILYTLVVIYSVIGLHYSYNLYFIGLLTKYIRDHLEPEVNRIMFTPSDKRTLLQWEPFSSKQRGTFPDILLSGLASIGTAVLLVLPSGFSLYLAQYILPTAVAQSQQSPFQQFVSVALPVLSSIAWALFITTIISIVLVAIYHAMKSRSLTMS